MRCDRRKQLQLYTSIVVVLGETLEYLRLPLRRAQVDKMDTHYIFEMKEGDLSGDERVWRSERRQRKRGKER